MQNLSLKWPIIITISVAAVELFVYNDVATPFRPLITFWFLLVCPGMAFVQLLRLRDALSEMVLAVALSLVLVLLTAGIMLYVGLWSPELILMLLIALCIVGVSCQLFVWIRSHADVEQA
jgi:hypothetical protein